MFLLDLLFPKRCVSCRRFGSYICKNCFSQIEFIEKPVCPICQRQAVGGRTHPGCRNRYRLDGLVVACRYWGPVKRATIQVKYKWVYDIEKVFVDLISENLWRFDLPRDAILVPVPLHAKRKRWRGFNQAEILGKSLAERFGVGYEDILLRDKETATQVGLKRDERKENVKGAFALRLPRHPDSFTPVILSASEGSFDSAQDKSRFFGHRPQNDIYGNNFILVDDVYTSGATMGECCRVLKRAGAGEVWGLCVAFG